MNEKEYTPFDDKSKLKDFLNLIFPQLDNDYIELRCVKKPTGEVQREFFSSINKFIEAAPQSQKEQKGFDVYWGVCSRCRESGTKEDIAKVWSLWADVDFKLFKGGEPEARKHLAQFSLQPSCVVFTGNGLHCYWGLKESVRIRNNGDVGRVEQYLRALQRALNADPAATDLSRVLRLPGTFNLKEPANPKSVFIELLEPDRLYSLQDFDGLDFEDYDNPGSKSDRKNEPGWIAEALDGLVEGNRHGTFVKIVGRLHRDRWLPEEITALLEPHGQACKFPLRELEGIVVDVCGRYRNNKLSDAPPILASEAYHGLAGDIVRAIEPQCESDPIALLMNTLVRFGVAVGRGPHYMVGNTVHHANEFFVIVGQSAYDRKGTSENEIAWLFNEADFTLENRTETGLSSGEGLIARVRDARIEQQPIKERGQPIRYEEVIVDAGEPDKRLLVIEPEFSQPLIVMKRPENTLRPNILKGWDGGRLSTMTKTRMSATGAHISIGGHIVREELKRQLDDVELVNGFANRFLWLRVERSKYLPNPKPLSEIVKKDLVTKLSSALLEAKKIGRMQRDEEAEGLWVELYNEIEKPKFGMIGALLARGSAHVLRLSMIYALLDKTDTITTVHLKAAKAIWDHVVLSVREIFQGMTGDRVADRMLSALQGGPMTTNEIYDGLFKGNIPHSRLQVAFESLLAQGLVEKKEIETGGRPATQWSVKKP